MSQILNPASIGSRHILVVDDDQAIRQLVSVKLANEGYEVWSATGGKHALDIIERRGFPHLAIVDIHMPEMDGFEFCEIVQGYVDLPVIMLTAVDDEQSVLRGIKYFAEDYITKPFSPRELAARVERVLRRIGSFSYTLGAIIAVDEFLEVDFAHRTARVDGKIVQLTPIENKILYIMMRNAPRVVTTDYLLERVWPLEEVYENVMRVHIHRLRQKIKTTHQSEEYIITERELGYRFRSSHG